MGRELVSAVTVLPPFYPSSRVQIGDSLSAQEFDDEQNIRVEDLILNNQIFYDIYCQQERSSTDLIRLNDFLDSEEFSPNYDGGSFFTEAVKRKDAMFLEKLVSKSKDYKICAANLLEAFTTAALIKDKDMLAVVAELARKAEINLTEIKDYDVYHRSSEIQSFIDDLLALEKIL